MARLEIICVLDAGGIRARKGKAYAFRFKAWTDYKAAG
jgi:hypothetical protein